MKNLVELKKDELREINGGDGVFGGGWKANLGIAGATIALFAAPFTGGLSLGVLAFGMFVLAANTGGTQ